jgi:hypothetical protein
MDYPEDLTTSICVKHGVFAYSSDEIKTNKNLSEEEKLIVARCLGIKNPTFNFVPDGMLGYFEKQISSPPDACNSNKATEEDKAARKAKFVEFSKGCIEAHIKRHRPQYINGALTQARKDMEMEYKGHRFAIFCSNGTMGLALTGFYGKEDLTFGCTTADGNKIVIVNYERPL